MLRIPLSALALAASLFLLGCGGGGTPSSSSSGGSVDTQPPMVSAQSLSPRSLSFNGGVATIQADVSDASGVLSVIATVQKSGGGTQQVVLSSVGGATYRGSYNAPANPNAGGQAETYAIAVVATDIYGNATPPVSVDTLTVTAPDSGDPVPPPPVFP